MTKVFLGGVCLALLWLVWFQGGLIARQRALIREMTRNADCMVIR